jgi:hypothetical protein
VNTPKHILNKPESKCQDDHLRDGLQILAKIIARELLAKHSSNAKDDDAKSANEKTSVEIQ